MLPAADLVVANAAQMVTMAGFSARPKRGRQMDEPGLIEGGWLAAKEGKIVAVGEQALVMSAVRVGPGTEVLDATGRLVTPGLVDPHTHLVFAGWREREMTARLRGSSYLDILAAGGGILSTVRETRRATAGELRAQAQGVLDRMLLAGTTTVEAKSGYGLTLADELKCLSVIRDLDRTHAVDVVPTFLGAHAVPPEYRDSPDHFVDLIVEEMLPAVAREGLAEFADVFCEEGVFSVDQSRRILKEARVLGFGLKLHADELAPQGGAELAAELGAVSADHLLHASPQGLAALADREVIAVLLPGTPFFLGLDLPPRGREMVDAGVPVALATDFNPGTCPVESMAIVMTLACVTQRLTPAEALAAATINAAHALRRADTLGSLEAGKTADLVIYDAPDYRFLSYRFGVNLVDTVIKGGRVVVRGGELVYD